MDTRRVDLEDIALLISILVSGIAVVVDEIVGSTFFQVLKIAGVFVSLGLAVHRIRVSKPYLKDVTPSDWTAVEDGFEISIPRSEHKRGKWPLIRCLYKNEHGVYGLFETSISPMPDGAVVVGVSRPEEIRIEVRK